MFLSGLATNASSCSSSPPPLLCLFLSRLPQPHLIGSSFKTWVNGKLVDTNQTGGGNPDAINGSFARLFVKLDREAAQKGKMPDKIETKPRFSTPIDVSAISISLGCVEAFCSN